jgi:DNA polymerase-3 subunit alpha
LGVYISSHPLEKWREKILQRGKNIASLKEISMSGTYTIVGVVDDLKEILTKKGQKMAFAKISDITASIEIVIFPKIFEEVRDNLKINEIYSFTGKLERKEDD